MIARLPLDGAVPPDPGSGQDVALAALTRRVADLEHRLNVMKIIVGLVLAGKVLLVVFFLYILFGHGLVVRSGGSTRSITEPAGLVPAGGAVHAAWVGMPLPGHVPDWLDLCL